MILASSPVLEMNRGRVRHRVDVAGTPENELYFDAPPEFASFVSPASDHFAVALLLPAMRSHQDLHLEGSITDELLFNLNGPVQAWIRSVLPVYSKVKVTATRSQSSGPRPAAVATGFSAGVDSYSVLGDYLFGQQVPDSLRVSHLLFNNVGAHDEQHLQRATVQLDNVRQLTSEWGVSVVDVNSNLDSHLVPLGTHTAFHNTHAVRNASVAHFLSGGVGTWLYASAVPFADVHGGTSDMMGSSDAIGLPLLSTSSLRLKAVGHERTRVEKTIQIATMTSAQVGLTVCIDPEWVASGNCSRCEKCLRTLFTLELTGNLDAFCPSRFDKDVYLAYRDEFAALVLSSDKSMNREIVDYAAQVDYQWARQARRKAASAGARRGVKKLLRSAKRRLMG